jgi:hypothetical protein
MPANEKSRSIMKTAQAAGKAPAMRARVLVVLVGIVTGSRVLSRSAFAATDPGVCAASVNTATIRRTFDFDIPVLVTLCMFGLRG